ncbi:MAG: imm11 family protein [Deltaproteobacteria bacterium]
MKYYRLIYKETNKELILVNNYDIKGLDLRKLWRGESIDKWDESIRLTYSKKGIAVDYLPNVLSWLIFSDKAVKVFKDMSIKNIQMFPVNITKGLKNEEVLKYNVVNILTSIPALNREKSDYAIWEDSLEEIKFIRKAVLNKVMINEDIDIFLLKEGVVYVIVSERLKKQLEINDITGVDFEELETI